jgi:hypothetical protein
LHSYIYRCIFITVMSKRTHKRRHLKHVSDRVKSDRVNELLATQRQAHSVNAECGFNMCTEYQCSRHTEAPNAMRTRSFVTVTQTERYRQGLRHNPDKRRNGLSKRSDTPRPQATPRPTTDTEKRILARLTTPELSQHQKWNRKARTIQFGIQKTITISGVPQILRQVIKH